MSLAGLDPTGGAGLLADIKTFEAHGLNGLGVCTALTAQTDDEFLGVEWIPPEKILAQALPLLDKFPVRFCKVGIVENPGVLLEVLPALSNARPGIRFILDPVLKASAGYVFHTAVFSQWEMVLDHIVLLTPNYEEAIAMSGLSCGESAARKMASRCAILLKGGHRPLKPGWDTLFTMHAQTEFAPVATDVPAKHGSGCVLSAAITASLAMGLSLEAACKAGKDYTLRYLQSSKGLLGHHTF